MISFITKLVDKVAHYIGMHLRLVKLNVIEGVSGILGYFLFLLIALFFILGMLIFLGMGLSEYFAELTSSKAGGYFITTGVYTLLILLFFAFKKKITHRFSGIFIKMLSADDEEDKHES